jgi:hypothetical protein
LLIGQLEMIKRDDADFERWRAGEERREMDELERALVEGADRAREAARAALTAAGYHQHKRGEWRRRHGN